MRRKGTRGEMRKVRTEIKIVPEDELQHRELQKFASPSCVGYHYTMQKGEDFYLVLVRETKE